MSPEFLKQFFTVKEFPDHLRNGHILNLPSAQTTFYGTNSILLRAYKMWNNLPLSIKQSQSLLKFKTNIKTLLSVYVRCVKHRKILTGKVGFY